MRSSLASLLIAASLAGGALSAATAYLAPLSLPDDQLLGLTLNAPAGAVKQPDGSLAPIAEKEKLTADLLETLRAADVRYVRVKEFSWRRWAGLPWFGLSLAGLLLGGIVLRSGNQPGTGGGAADGTGSTPRQSLANVHAQIVALRRELTSIPAGRNALTLVLDRLTALQQTEMTEFTEARGPLIAQLGLAGFAEVMDRWAAAERQINRAWSAAADDVYDEVIDCLALAQTHLEEALGELEETPSASPERSVS